MFTAPSQKQLERRAHGEAGRGVAEGEARQRPERDRAGEHGLEEALALHGREAGDHPGEKAAHHTGKCKPRRPERELKAQPKPNTGQTQSRSECPASPAGSRGS